MHVLLATNNLYPDPGATGSGRYNYEVGRELVERGHDVTVITRLRGEVPERETVEGMDVHRYRASMVRFPSILRTIRRRVEAIDGKQPIDLLGFHGALSSLGVDRAVGDDVPRIYTVHGLWSVEYGDRLVDPAPWAYPWHWLNRTLRHRIETRLLRRSDRAIVLSEFMRTRVTEHHAEHPPITVVPGGVDPDRFAPTDEPAHDAIDEDEISVLTVRRLTPRMGIETLLDAFAQVARSDVDPHLYVGGDGQLRAELVSRAERLGIDDRVTFLGYVPEDELPACYASADLFVLPTLELEGFGLVTIEALASGTPVIGTNAGATPELLGPLADDTAVSEPLLVDAGDADALAAGLESWTDRSAAERTNAGAAARSYVLEEGYTWADATDRLVDVFEAFRA